jgi:hypothetical protein
MTAANSHTNVAAIRQRLQDSYAQLCALLDGPLSTLVTAKLYQTPDENEWSITQSLAHIQEFLPYWAEEVEKLLAHPGQNFGRTMQDEGRLEALRVHGYDTLRQLKEALPGSYARLDDVLSRLQESDLELTARHVRFGEHTLEWFIDEFITGHLHGHVMQLQACLAALG